MFLHTPFRYARPEKYNVQIIRLYFWDISLNDKQDSESKHFIKTVIVVIDINNIYFINVVVVNIVIIVITTNNLPVYDKKYVPATVYEMTLFTLRPIS